MDEWQVGDPIGLGNDAGVPDIPYMGYLNGDDEDEDDMPYEPAGPRMSWHEQMAEEAYELQKKGRFEEALRKINCALSADSNNPEYWNIKAIILSDWGRGDEALKYYDKSLDIRDNDTVRSNKAVCLYKLSNAMKITGDWQEALDYINQAFAIMPDDEPREGYLRLKGSILESMGRQVQSKKCFLLANGRYDEIEELERNEKLIKSSTDTLINIAGTKFYKGSAPLRPGVIVDLVKEPENEHDLNAIRVEIDGETVGYVGNGPNTVPEGIKSASKIKEEFETRAKAEVMFHYLDYCIIAKLVK